MPKHANSIDDRVDGVNLVLNSRRFTATLGKVPNQKLPPEVAEYFRQEAAEKKRKHLPPAVVNFFRQTGAKGGKARAKSTTPERRAEIAKAAAVARWGKKEKAATPKTKC